MMAGQEDLVEAAAEEVPSQGVVVEMKTLRSNGDGEGRSQEGCKIAVTSEQCAGQYPMFTRLRDDLGCVKTKS